ncbi:MAG: hypothetical protein ACTSRU_19845 [Candidatus Hodarchaeales archaeon]
MNLTLTRNGFDATLNGDPYYRLEYEDQRVDISSREELLQTLDTITVTGQDPITIVIDSTIGIMSSNAIELYLRGASIEEVNAIDLFNATETDTPETPQRRRRIDPRVDPRHRIESFFE